MKWLKSYNKNYNWLIFFYFFLVSGCATNETVVNSLKHVNQNATYYAQLPEADYTLKSEKQKSFSQDFIEHYFSPWNDLSASHSKNILKSIKQEQIESAELFLKNPGWGLQYKHSTEWAHVIVANMNLDQFSKLNRKAITVHDTMVRGLPTKEPSYDSKDLPGHCYPFDNLQESFLPASTPIRIVHVSKDGYWYLIRTPSYEGWALKKDIAFVSQKFIKHWQATHYVVPTQDSMDGRIGAFYPLHKKIRGGYQIYTAAKDSHQYAVVKTAELNELKAALFPVPFTPQNIATIANRLVGKPYGWGGLNGYRDCSATLQDLFTPFGIWLPRNSGSQSKQGQSINLRGLSNTAKREIIQKQGIPFLTLIHIPGHIMLYIGKQERTVYVFHDMWGLHTQRLFAPPGRAVVGKTVITPIDFGEGYINVSRNLLKISSELILLAEPKDINKKVLVK